MTLIARYSGTCPACGLHWQPGDLIRARGAEDDPEWPWSAAWEHAVCPDPLAVEHPVCPVCFLVHPEGKCDR